MVEKIISLPVEKIIVDEPNRLKKDTTEDGVLLELQSNIKQYGVKVPLLVAEHKDGSYHLVDGYRRLQIAIALEHEEIICTLTDKENTSEIALSVNLHREDLTPVAIGKLLYKIYVTKKADNPKFKYSHLSSLVNKSKAFISQHIGYIEKLSEEIQTDIIDNNRMIDKNILTRIYQLDEEDQEDIYQQVVKNNLNRQEVQNLINELNKEEEVQESNQEVSSSTDVCINEDDNDVNFELITIISTNTLELKISKNAVSNLEQFEMDFEMLIHKYNLFGEV